MKRVIRVLAVTFTVVMILGTVSAMAATVSFRHGNGTIYSFNSSSVSNWVGRNQSNNFQRVSMIQAANNTITGFPRISIDGIFGGETNRSIEHFQARYRIDVDGIAGRDTWTEINSERGAAAPGNWRLPFIV
jgi:peptidoglycan hydrolase-like protein with peptidoglycan-binding domain